MSRKVKKIMALFMGLVLCFSFVNPVHAENMSSDEGEKYIYIDEQGNEITIECIETEDLLVVNQYNHNGDLVESVKNIHGTDIITIYNAETKTTMNTYVNNFGIKSFENSLSEGEYQTNRAVAYTFLGNIVFMPHGELNIYTMKVAYQLNYEGVTTYEITSTKGSVASIVASIAVGIGVGAKISNYIVGAIVAGGLGYIINNILNISTTISLACDRYRVRFHTYDNVYYQTYNRYGDYGYKYIVKDINHPDKINDSFYDGITHVSLQDGDTISYDTLLYTTYNKHGVIDFAESTVFN